MSTRNDSARDLGAGAGSTRTAVDGPGDGVSGSGGTTVKEPERCAELKGTATTADTTATTDSATIISSSSSSSSSKSEGEGEGAGAGGHGHRRAAGDASGAAGVFRWAFDTAAWEPTQEEWTRAAQCVQPEEKERIGKFMFKEDAKLAIVGRLLLRKAASAMLAVPSSTLELGRSKRNKPYVAKPVSSSSPAAAAASSKDVHVNVTHHGNFVLLASDPRYLCGVDVMQVDDLPGYVPSVDDFLKDFTRQFASGEWETIMAQSTGPRRLEQFYRLWALKESFIKATGIGLLGDLRLLDFRQDATEFNEAHSPAVVERGTRVSVAGRDAAHWRFHISYVDRSHVAAVAVGPAEDAVCAEAAGEDVITVAERVHDVLSDADERLRAVPFVHLSFGELISSLTPVPAHKVGSLALTLLLSHSCATP